ncbi:M1 family metallopeptidase [Streptomyces sp. V3I7]|uniref:M1 family metallopeptidase n=1 Tax=Streptomyces sp. V3I7 TaxID=3042278 RepID=UPI00278B1EA5|nr:M1 family metallopeptidase [Streptomyces sp. V3I7]MDQ0991583.1 aminopeptidase N [Streptomyces sp. V3I7]
MSRSARLVPPAALLLAFTLTGCASGVYGTPGGAGVHDPYFPKAGNGGYDVTHYDLDLSYTPDTHHLTGEAVITARATQDMSAFDLDLEGLDVESVRVDGDDARWNRAGQELTVRPKRDLDTGQTFRTTVRYAGVPRTITDTDGSREGWLRTADGAVALGQPVGSMAWFPGNNHPSDKATYDITVSVPKGLEAVSNGELTRRTDSGGRTSFTWHTGRPMASYLATVAVGRFDVTRSRTPDGLPVYTAVDPTQSSASRTALARIPEILAWSEKKFGPYPFASTGAIVERGGDADYALETQSRPVFPGAPDTLLVVHELAHEWYGDSVTPRTWRDIWLSEGFATYAEWLWREDHGGRSAEQTFQAYYDHGERNYGDLWAFPPAEPTDAAHISDDPVYHRGAMVLHKIRQKTGDDAFFRIARGWVAEHRYGNASTAEFTAYVEKSAPDKDFRGIWDDWLYGDGRPDRP